MSFLSLQENGTSHSGLSISTSDQIKEVAQEEEGLEGHLDNSKMESDDEEIDTANVCFIANEEETLKVTLETSLDYDELTMDKFARFFEELQSRYEISNVQNKTLRKENDILKIKLVKPVGPKAHHSSFDDDQLM